MKKYIKDNPDKFPYIYNEDEDAIYSKDGKYMSSLDTFVKIYRKHTGQSFECIYSCHVDLSAVLKCTECGTVIFTYEDESYDDNLKCPTCTDYKTYFKFWTKEEIDSDQEKQNTINWYKEMTEYEIEREKRIKRRNGKQDWEIAKKEFRGKKIYLQFILECDDITESYFKGLRLDIRCGKKDSDGGYTVNKFFTIPLSWSRFYLQFIYRHLGKCHPDFRSKWYIGKAIEKKDNKKK
jgi:hypothetical protein